MVIVLGFELEPFMLFYTWLIIGLLFLVCEMGTPGLFFFLAFALGAFMAAPMAYFGYPFMIQCLTALAGCLFFFFVLRKAYAVPFRSSGEVKTNVGALVGQEAVVIAPISHFKSGLVKIRSEQWPAKTDKREIIEHGAIVKVIRIEGNHVVVTK